MIGKKEIILLMIHVVSAGETVASIAARYGVSEQRIRYDNQLFSFSGLVPGQALLILQPRTVHVAAPGETLEGIASGYGMTVRRLLQNNPWLLQQPYLTVGEEITIDYERMEGLSGLGGMELTGYAYPFIQMDILREVLLYLDELLIFSYGFTTEGELIPPQGEEILLAEAEAFGVPAMLVLTPFGENGSFNNMLVKLVSENQEVQQNVISNLLAAVQEKGYAGVDVDFEYILPEDRLLYAQFVGNLRERLAPYGYKVSVALPPKTSADQPGLLYEGADYYQLGRNADTVLLMTYEWGYTYGPPMAVAPLNKVREVVEYAVSEIEPDKIYMGVPNYAYDWALPFKRGESRAATIGNVDAVLIAEEAGVQIQFDETAQSPWFTYEKNNVTHEVWFEDVRSILAKANLAAFYGLRGLGYWNLMKPFRANWLMLAQRY